MEHKLITGGGEHFLPFARSRIKALKALGRANASQQFEIDGYTVKVRLDGGHEYIRIEGGCKLAMDSGFIGLTGWPAPFSPHLYAPAFIAECEPFTSYRMTFSKIDPDGKGRTNPSNTSHGQFAGTIKNSGGYKGHLRDYLDLTPAFSQMSGRHTPNSFKPTSKSVEPATTPPTIIYDPKDIVLLQKKYVVANCPASIFTGKTRLWIQSIYGLPLYAGSTPNYIPGLIKDTSAAPALNIKSYVTANDPKSYPEVMVDTSCGVLLDSLGQHWLIQLNNGNIRIFPLISSACGEKMRASLVAKDSKGAAVLNDVDKEHLEAYILSQCLPDYSRVFESDTKYTCGSYSMGYGWHWNWGSNKDQLKAVIIVTEVFGPDWAPMMRSTTWEMGVAIMHRPKPAEGWKVGDVRETWSIGVFRTSGPSEWGLDRTKFCIAEPNYRSGLLMKTLPNHSTFVITAAEPAPFYAYYSHNTLVECKVQVTGMSVSASREMTPGFAGSDVPGADDITGDTLGPYNGFIKQWDASSEAYRIVFYVGKEKTGSLMHGFVQTGLEFVVDNKTLSGGEDMLWGPDLSIYPMFYAESGQPLPPNTGNTGVYATHGIANVFASRGHSPQMSWRNVGYYRTKTMEGTAMFVVPFNDSEAVHLHWSELDNTHTDATTRTTTTDNSPTYSTGWILRTYTSPGADVWTFAGDRFYWQHPGPGDGGMPTVVETLPATDEGSPDTRPVLYYKGGKLEGVWTPPSDAFFGINEDISLRLDTYTGVSEQNGMAFSPSAGIISGVTWPSAGDPASVVGWI